MSFKRVDECLPAWLRAEIEKMAAAVEAAAKSRGNIIMKADADAATATGPHMRPVLCVVSSRDRPAHAPRARPTLGAGRSLLLVVDNGKSSRIAGGGTRDPAYQRDREETVSG